MHTQLVLRYFAIPGSRFRLCPVDDSPHKAADQTCIILTQLLTMKWDAVFFVYGQTYLLHVNWVWFGHYGAHEYFLHNLRHFSSIVTGFHQIFQPFVKIFSENHWILQTDTSIENFLFYSIMMLWRIEAVFENIHGNYDILYITLPTFISGCIRLTIFA